MMYSYQPSLRRGKLENRLASLYGCSHAVLFGRARSALAAVVKTFHPRGPAIIPATICPTVYSVFWKAGCPVSLADIDVETGLSSDAALATRLTQANAPSIVMPTHLYGFTGQYSDSVDKATESKWLVVENDAYATGLAVADLGRREKLGDVTLMSFGAGKTLDAGEGGVLLLDDSELACDLRRIEATFPRLSTDDHEAEAYFTCLRRMLRSGIPITADAVPLTQISQHLLPYETEYLERGFNDAGCEALEVALDGFTDNIARRCVRNEEWRRRLDGLGDTIVWVAADQPAPWRTIVRVPGKRDKVVAALRVAGFDAGTNFPSLTGFYPSVLGEQPCTGAEQWEGEVMNLWLSDDYNDARIAAAADVIAGAVET